MAFRKRTRRFSRRFRAPVARKRRTWVQALNIDPCQFLELDHCQPNDGCCTDKAGIELLGQTTLQDQFSDRAVVRRVLGDLWFSQNAGTITSAEDVMSWNLWLAQVQQFLGLRVGEVNSQNVTAPLYDVWATNFDDLAEGQWKKTWQHMGDARAQISLGANLASSFDLNIPASDVHTTGSTIPGAKACSSLASGSGQICIDTSIDCQACPQGLNANAINWSTAQSFTPASWHVHVDVRRRIPLRENQLLYMIYNERHFGGQAPFADSFTAIRGNIRCLVEMG